MASDRVEAVLDRLGSAKRTADGQWRAHCPSHNDRNPSLFVKEGDDGKPLLWCGAGCSFKEVMEALGLDRRDALPSKASNGNGTRRPSASWDIKDAAGEVQAVHVRFDKPEGGKECMWRLPGEAGWGLGGRSVSGLPLYRAELVWAWSTDEPVVVVEGEKAADALAEVYPYVVGTVTGSGTFPAAEALEVLQERKVILWPDNDPPGRTHMENVATTLMTLAAEVRFYAPKDAPPKGDAADHPAVLRGDATAIREELTEAANTPRTVGEVTVKEPHRKNEDLGTLLSDVEPEQVEWLWDRRIPLGKITILEGDPGNGKSALTTDLAARLSVGRTFPDGQPCEPAGVVIMNAEDGLADTIRPRLDAAYGDPTRVLSLATVPTEVEDDERYLSVPEDVKIMEAGIEKVGARLLIVDPFMAFLSANSSAHKDQDVRRALAPLKSLAERTGAAVLLIRHLNKTSGGNALYRGGGSIGIIGAARSALLVGVHPEDENMRVLAGQKANLSEMPESLAYRVVTAANGAARIEYAGLTEAKADTLLRAPVDAEERSALGEAIQFLREELKDGPVWAQSVKKHAHRADISEATLKRAKQALNVGSNREGTEGWSWYLPGKKLKTPGLEP